MGGLGGLGQRWMQDCSPSLFFFFFTIYLFILFWFLNHMNLLSIQKINKYDVGKSASLAEAFYPWKCVWNLACSSEGKAWVGVGRGRGGSALVTNGHWLLHMWLTSNDSARQQTRPCQGGEGTDIPHDLLTPPGELAPHPANLLLMVQG